MTTIERIHAREVLDSRGKPTVEVEVQCGSARAGRAIVPSGASTGRFEAWELRDGGDRLDGLGVRKAVGNVNGEIAAALIGRDAGDQAAIDRLLCELDGTDNKSRLGANAILGASLATACAAAEARGLSLCEHLQSVWKEARLFGGRPQRQSVPESLATMSTEQKAGLLNAVPDLGHAPLMPLPMVNMISGGLHAGGNLDIQDVLILPVGAASFPQALDWIVTVYRRLGSLLTEAGYEGYLVGDEGGFGPKLETNREALEFTVRAIEAAGLTPGEQVAIGLDVAATHFFDADAERYRFTGNGPARSPAPAGGRPADLTAAEMIERLAGWVEAFPIVSIEDGLAEDDWDGWRALTDRLGDRVQLVGDDLFVTNRQRLERGIATGVANSVLIKLNQIGTLSETLETMRVAIDAGYRPVVSARSGETEDALIADLAVATGAGQIKIGSIARSERLAKYNQLLRLNERYGDNYLGGRIFR